MSESSSAEFALCPVLVLDEEWRWRSGMVEWVLVPPGRRA